MECFFAAVLVFLAGAALAALSGRHVRAANLVGPAAAVIGSVLVLGAAVPVLIGAGSWTADLPWAMPGGRLLLGLDPLSALFLLPGAVLGAVCALSGKSALAHREHGLALHWACYNLTLAATALMLAARHALPFLMAWEVMSVAPFFCITLEDREERVRSAGWLYFVAGHAGAAALLVLFLLLGRAAGGLDFAAFRSIAFEGPGLPLALFFLGLFGFGSKAGLMPVHFWLPEAHPAAPSHFSAYLSGALIKAGVYGFLRLLTFLGPTPSWWGPLLVGLGAVTAVLGILHSLAQSELKRLLAYSSVENIGIIFLGIGAGLTGLAAGSPAVTVLGFAGALLHVLNHCLVKGLLFLSAGSVLHGAGTTDLERLGGLLKRLPVTGAAFALGAAAICGLPPLNAFSGELLLYLSAAADADRLSAAQAASLWAAAAGLAFVGGLAAYALAKGFGVAFLGEPRSPAAAKAHETPRSERLPLLVLAACCVLAALGSPALLTLVLPAVGQLAEGLAAPGSAGTGLALQALTGLALASGGLILLLVLLALLRRRLLRNKPVTASETWGCGYLAPTARMQYTGSSFAEPLVRMTAALLGHRVLGRKPEGLFPEGAWLRTETPDRVLDLFLRPAFAAGARLLDGVKRLQHGKTNLYILYVLATLLFLLLWRFARP